MSITADRLIIIGRGCLIAQKTVKDLLTTGSGTYVRVRTAELRPRNSVALERQHRACQSDDTLHEVAADVVGNWPSRRVVTLQELSEGRSIFAVRPVDALRLARINVARPRPLRQCTVSVNKSPHRPRSSPNSVAAIRAGARPCCSQIVDARRG